MSGLQSYLLSIIGAALISAVVSTLVEKKGTPAAVIRLLTGLFLALTVISPLTKFHLTDWKNFYDDIEIEADSIIAEGEKMALQATSEIIKEDLEAYILDKATSLQLDVEVELYLTDASPPVPEIVEIRGEISPYGKQVLKDFMLEKIGIAEDKQRWMQNKQD